MTKSRHVLVLVAFFILLLLATGVSFVVLDIGRAPSVPPSSYLEIGLEGPLVEYSGSHPFASLFGGRALSVHDVWMGLRKARVDDRIVGVLLRLGPLACDWAKCSEIREAVLEFRSSGKKIYATIEEIPNGTKEYYLATACDKIFLHPLGWFGIAGVGGDVPFFKKALDKLGLEAQVVKVDQYKTAYNMFTESGFTPAHREMMESIISDEFAHFTKTIAAARAKSEADVRALIDEAFFQGDRAVASGLVDGCFYSDQVAALFERGGRRAARIPLSVYARIDPGTLGLGTGRKVALIYAMGAIHGGESLAGSMGADTIVRALHQAVEDRSIAAIVFRVDSPGGSAVASDSIWREVMLCREKKPFVVSMSDLAGSGGYWISMAAHKIVAQPQTLTGSIGVLSGKISLEKMLAKIGVTSEQVGIGRHAGLFSPFRSLTAEDTQLMKKQILWIYDRFLAKVAEGRGLTKDAVDAIGKGRVWTGRQAKDLRLVDELGGLTRAVEIAKDLAGIPKNEDVRFVVWPQRESLWRLLFGPAESRLSAALPKDIQAAVAWAERLGEDRIWAVMPILLGPEAARSSF